jgi:hypothetical protein
MKAWRPYTLLNNCHVPIHYKKTFVRAACIIWSGGAGILFIPGLW